ncbi:MAG: FxsA family protein [Actinobacteria bacterium]|nr:FxsA family protein [Actinomycetota bacterium]
MPLVLLIIVFIVVPIVELWLILQVAELLGGGATGAALTIGLLVLDSLLGAALLRSQGRAVWRQFTGAIDERRMPAREIVDGGFVIVGGVLLLTPGFLSDLLGVLMLLPPTRRVFGGWVMGLLSRRVRLAFSIADTGLSNFQRSRQPRRWDYEAEDIADGVTERAPDTAFSPPELSDGDDPDFDFQTPHRNQ